MVAVRQEQGVPDEFPAPVSAAAEAALAGAGAARVPRPRVLPATGSAAAARRADRTDVALVTIDPPGSRDLDQAYGAERRRGGGLRVWYAIADVAAFVAAGRRRRRRGPPPGRDVLRPRPARPAPPAGAERGRGQPAARRRPPGAAVVHRPRRRRRAGGDRGASGPWSAAGPSSPTTRCRPRWPTAPPTRRCLCCGTSASAALAAEAARGWRQPADPRPGGHARARRRPATRATTPRCRPRPGTRRCRCSRAWRRRAS